MSTPAPQQSPEDVTPGVLPARSTAPNWKQQELQQQHLIGNPTAAAANAAIANSAIDTLTSAQPASASASPAPASPRPQTSSITPSVSSSSFSSSTPESVASSVMPASIHSISKALPGMPWLDAIVGATLSSTLSHFHCSGVCPHESCFLAVVRGLRQGIVYGAKVRFPHALVMTLLFRKGPLSVKVQDVLRATYQHSFNLGRYAALFKLLECGMRHVRQKESGLNQLAAGFVAGGVMFGSNTPINSQINMYVMSRVIFGLARMTEKKGWVVARSWFYPLYAATIWALVMWIFESDGKLLQSSLATSMKYLYHDSNRYPKHTESLVEWLRQ